LRSDDHALKINGNFQAAGASGLLGLTARKENMPKLKPGTVPTTDEEDHCIKEGIAEDPDTSEMTDEMFANARPASEVHPKIVEWYKRTRGKQKKPVKMPIYIRLDNDIVEHFKSGGKGWQTKINDALRKSINSQHA
jgi:uncharacterized protein (DUF4415 family)